VYYIIGSKGRLGQVLATRYSNYGVVELQRADYEGWVKPKAIDDISRYFDCPSSEGATVFVASGLLDPNLSPKTLRSVNYQLPKNVIDGAGKIGIKVVTFGTIMEEISEYQNSYVQSKIELKNYVNEVSQRGQSALHLQMHTLFGIGLPSPFMFLGQILSAIRKNQAFKMTSGRQRREYHHYEDEVEAIQRIVSANGCGVRSISHGQSLRLKTIAESVFHHLGKSDLLQVGALPDPPEEIYEENPTSLEAVPNFVFRDTLPAICEYMRRCYDSKETEV